MMQTSFAPIATLQECSPDEANALLVSWGHKMGPLNRGSGGGYSIPGAYVLLHESTPLAVATHSTLIRDHVGAGLGHITRENGIELSRLCAARAGICRVMLRMWRELVFPSLGYQFAVSYQDADLHSGATYKNDGWTRSEEMSRSGTDHRGGGAAPKRGRRKWIWWWECGS